MLMPSVLLCFLTTPGTGTDALVWTRDSVEGTWDGPVQLTYPTAAPASYMNNVDISGDGQFIVTGNTGLNGEDGAFWVFKKSVAGTWDLVGQYDPPASLSSTSPPRLGSAVTINYDGTVIAAGASRYNDYRGATLIYRLQGSFYEYSQLLPSPTTTINIFGSSAALDQAGVG